MAGVNKVILVGNLGKDPEVKYLDNGVVVANFSLATTESYKNKEGIIKLTTEAGLGFSGIDEGDEREIGHTLKSLLIDPNGLLVSSYPGDNWLPKEVEKNIIEKLKIYSLD